MYTPILATLIYVLSPDKESVLMLQRNKRKDDQHFGKYNGLGGKLERNEDVITGMQRELKEESGLTATNYQLRGTISWPGFGKNGEDWFAFVFLVDEFEGELLVENDEGDLVWVLRDELLELPLWEGDINFLSLVFDQSDKPFYGCMPYLKGKMLDWSYVR